MVMNTEILIKMILPCRKQKCISALHIFNCLIYTHARIRCSAIIGNLKNFTVKYNSPTNYEMKVVKKSINKITYKIPLKSPFYIKDNKLTFFEQSPFTKKNYYSYTANEQCYCN